MKGFITYAKINYVLRTNAVGVVVACLSFRISIIFTIGEIFSVFCDSFKYGPFVDEVVNACKILNRRRRRR